MAATSLSATLPPLIKSHRILLVTSRAGASRRSTAYVRHLATPHDVMMFSQSGDSAGEPSWKMVQVGAEIARRTGRSMIICLGGRSVMDLGKAVASKAGLDDYVITIPTIPCGGTESSDFASVVDWDQDELIQMPKLKCHPVIAGTSPKELVNLDRSPAWIWNLATCATLIRKSLVEQQDTTVQYQMPDRTSSWNAARVMELSMDGELHRTYHNTLHAAVVDAITSLVPVPRLLTDVAMFKAVLGFIATEEGMSSNFASQHLQWCDELLQDNAKHGNGNAVTSGVRDFLKSHSGIDVDDDTMTTFAIRTAELYLIRRHGLVRGGQVHDFAKALCDGGVF